MTKPILPRSGQPGQEASGVKTSSANHAASSQSVPPDLLAARANPPHSAQEVNLDSESVAGEEDPGASLDMPAGDSFSGGGTRAGPVSEPPATLNPGDEAPAGTPGTGESICRECGGSGRRADAVCPACNGSGKITVGVGGG